MGTTPLRGRCRPARRTIPLIGSCTKDFRKKDGFCLWNQHNEGVQKSHHIKNRVSTIVDAQPSPLRPQPDGSSRPTSENPYNFQTVWCSSLHKGRTEQSYNPWEFVHSAVRSQTKFWQIMGSCMFFVRIPVPSWSTASPATSATTIPQARASHPPQDATIKGT